MSAETAAAHKNDPAVVCCRTEAGTVISADNLEDPGIFPDLVDSGLLKLDDSVLTVGQAIGSKLLETIDSLTPITRENAEVNETEEEPAEEAAAEETAAAVNTAIPVEGGVIKICISEGKDIVLEFPAGV